MPRLIDADKLKECFPDDTFKNRMVKVIIDRQPTAIPRPHGRIVDMNKVLEVIAIEWGYEGIEDDLEDKVPTIIEAEMEWANGNDKEGSC